MAPSICVLDSQLAILSLTLLIKINFIPINFLNSFYLNRPSSIPHLVFRNFDPLLLQCPNTSSQHNRITLTKLLTIIPITTIRRMHRSLFLQDDLDSTESKQQLKRFTFYIFIDQSFGLGAGKQLLRLETEQICLLLDDEGERHNSQEKRLKFDIHIYFYDIHDCRRMETALENLKYAAESKSRKVRIMICGDESTLGHLVSLTDTLDVPIQNVPIGFIPAGHHNDLSSVLGWGDSESAPLVGQDLKHIKEHARKWTKAIIEKIDTWKVELETNEDGEIETVDRDSKRKVKLQGKVLKQVMVSHLNIGVHARIGMGFELNKGDSSIGNKWVQAFEGFKKMMCMVTPKVDKMVSLVEIKVEGERRDKQTYRTLFSSKEEQEENTDKKYLDSTASLACLNIDTYRGLQEVWKHSSSDSPRHSYSTQSYHDGKLEFVTFDSTLSTTSKKLCQADGSIQLKLQRHQPTYIQIDNIPYKLTHPTAIRIERGRKLQVLINKESLMTQ